MKKFKYKFTPLMKGLIIAGLALSAAGFTVNLVVCITNGVSTAANPVYPALQYALMFFATIMLIVLLTAILFRSEYVVTDDYFITRFGIITSKYDLKKIETVVLDRKTDKLAVTFDDENYIVVVVKQDWYNDFIEALLDANPKIEYSIISVENKPDDKKDEK